MTGSRTALRALVENAATDMLMRVASAICTKAAAAVEKAGLAPLAGELKAIDAMTSPRSCRLMEG